MSLGQMNKSYFVSFIKYSSRIDVGGKVVHRAEVIRLATVRSTNDIPSLLKNGNLTKLGNIGTPLFLKENHNLKILKKETQKAAEKWEMDYSSRSEVIVLVDPEQIMAKRLIKSKMQQEFDHD